MWKFKLLASLWEDDQGAILSTEYVLLSSLLVFGLLPGLVALRDSTNRVMEKQASRIENISNDNLAPVHSVSQTQSQSQSIRINFFSSSSSSSSPSMEQAP